MKFYDLSEELSEEGARVVDYGIYNSKDIPEVIETFLNNLTEYSKEKEKGSEFVFVYGNKEGAKAATYTIQSTGDVTIRYGTNSFILSSEETYVFSDIFVPTGEEIEIGRVSLI